MDASTPALDVFRPYRLLLWILAAVGFFGLNGVFLYYALVHPELAAAALQNPVRVVFVLEAFLLMAGIAWVIRKADVEKPGWLAFIALSIVGSFAFGVPAFILWHLRKQEDG